MSVTSLPRPIYSTVAILLMIWMVDLAIAQDVDVEKDSRYCALAWMQNSAEYRLLTEQTYRAALLQLQVGLQDPHWSADEVQLAVGGFEHKQPAIILDCDETVLDNSAYNARRVSAGEEYTTESWNDWCQEAKATAVPGSLDFVNAAKSLGVKIFFITNRRDVVKDATIKNLKELGFPASQGNVLTKNPEQGRGDDKVSRRAMVAKNHRIVLLIGDSMSDLCSGMDSGNLEERNQVASEKRAMLGSRWIMLPNPVYGGWQRALPSGEKALKLSR
ncbi:5'-nucleotidase, lipoprotein e(P4) family [Roseiconus lacunae]|uniref:HAD family acid phosphatase n=1 Tax=Roseiconus lacunae TaxID=2605694 RepID=A0ABT7PS70_9BACT|nr:HAD family acid phosphatase [Roseiconus lacunae]MDM4019326.1 HAD family acid phosphatase [Roseiconus lacunae]